MDPKLHLANFKFRAKNMIAGGSMVSVATVGEGGQRDRI